MSGFFYFTSVTTNYIPKARILAKSLKKYNDAKFVLALSDDPPDGFNVADEPFDDVILTDKLARIENVRAFFFRHNVTEICTAVKPLAALEIMDKYGADKVCYLDPDIVVFSELAELDGLLDKYSMIFTPHTTIPEESDYYIRGNEILFLKRGTNNLGFFAVKNDDEGRRFLNWWNDRLTLFCLDDDYALLSLLDESGLLGVFTDQKWIDMVPSFFDNYLIWKHPGYNVSTWNLSHRIVDVKAENYTINGQPLRFFHFSGIDSNAHLCVMQKLMDDYPHVRVLRRLTEWYIGEEKINGQPELGKIEWKYARYSTGELIPKTHRKILQMRRDIIPTYPDPFEKNEGNCFYEWLYREYEDILTPIENARPPDARPLRKPPSQLFRLVKKLVTLFVKPDTPLYFRLRKIWRAVRY